MNSRRQILTTQIIPRILIAIVTGWNLLCAVQFILQSEAYPSGFNLEGEVGIAVVRSMGVLFLMWNVPYLMAVIHPRRWSITLAAALGMQLIGLIGEIWIRSRLISATAMQASVLRFIQFDAAGLVLLCLAYFLVARGRSRDGI